MAYEMPRVSAFCNAIVTAPSTYVLTTVASIHGLWASAFCFQEFDEATY